MRNNRRRNRKGFTLIEIIAVLILLAILAALAIPRYFTMQKEAAQQTIIGAISEVNACMTQQWAKSMMSGATADYSGCGTLDGFAIVDSTAFTAAGAYPATFTIVNNAYPTGTDAQGTATQQATDTTTTPPHYKQTAWGTPGGP